MDVTINVDLEKFRYSLVGDGYMLSEVIGMSNKELIDVLQRRVTSYISVEYNRSVKRNLLNERIDFTVID